VGRAPEPKVDIAVDPVDGTRLLASGMPNSIAVLAIAERGAMYRWEDIAYMDKIAVGPECRGVVDLNASPTENLNAVAKAKGERVRDLTAVILDRPRHAELIEEVRASGARIRLIPDGDVVGALSTCFPDTGADILLGIGGTPEGVITACAVKCLGGEQLGRLYVRNDDERRLALDAGYDLERILTENDLVASENCFFAATGITDGELMKGVHFDARGATTQSLVMRSKSGTVRRIDARHSLDKLSEFSAVPFS